MRAKSLQLCPTLHDAMDHSPPDSSVYGILQARILEWVSMSSSRESSSARDQTHDSRISCTGRQVLYTGTTWEANCESLYCTPVTYSVVHKLQFN